MADMDRERFEALLDAYGADPRRWPHAERPAAEAFAAQNPAAFDLIAEAARTDDLLAMTPAAAPSSALREAVIAAAGARPARRPSLWWLGAGLGAALAGAAAGAVTVGVLAPGVTAEFAVDPVFGAATAFGDLDEGAAP